MEIRGLGGCVASRVLVAIVVVLALSGCGAKSSSSVDAGPPTPPDGSIPADLPLLVADYASCAGSAAPLADGRGPIVVVAQDLTVPAALFSDLTVRYFEGNDVHDAPCVAPGCQEVVVGPDGSASLMSQLGGWSAYRVFGRPGPTPSTTPLDSVAYNVRAPSVAGGVLDVAVVPDSLGTALVGCCDRDAVPGSGVLLVRVVDCAGNPVAGAVVVAYHGDAPLLTRAPSAAARYVYLGDDRFPVGDATSTMGSGRAAALDLPVDTVPVRIEAWGPTAAGLTLLGCESVPLLADGVALVDLGPLRTDYPPGHPCAR